MEPEIDIGGCRGLEKARALQKLRDGLGSGMGKADLPSIGGRRLASGFNELHEAKIDDLHIANVEFDRPVPRERGGYIVMDFANAGERDFTRKLHRFSGARHS